MKEWELIFQDNKMYNKVSFHCKGELDENSLVCHHWNYTIPNLLLSITTYEVNLVFHMSELLKQI